MNNNSSQISETPHPFINKLYSTYCRSIRDINKFYSDDCKSVIGKENDVGAEKTKGFGEKVEFVLNQKSIHSVIVSNISMISNNEDENYFVIGSFQCDKNQVLRFSHSLILDKEKKIKYENMIILDETIVYQDKEKYFLDKEKNTEFKKKKSIIHFNLSQKNKSLNDLEEIFRAYGEVDNVRFSNKIYSVEFKSKKSPEDAFKDKENLVSKGIEILNSYEHKKRLPLMR